MGMVIDLERRLIELEKNMQLHFATDDSLFYLRVIALVAQRMKDGRSDADGGAFVSIEEIEEQAWAFNKDKARPFKSKSSMKTNIYQVWEGRLKCSEEGSVYEAIRSNGMKLSNSDQSRISRLFKRKVGQGPERAAFKIAHDPESIEIVGLDSYGKASGGRIVSPASLSELDEDGKVQRFAELLAELMMSTVYQDSMSVSIAAIRTLLSSQESLTDHRGGHLPHPIDYYADEYVKHLGVKGVPGSVLMWSWLDELAVDYRWERCMMNRDMSPSPAYAEELPDPRKCAKLWAEEGDIISLLWLFHMAYVASAFAVKRKRFLSLLDQQATSVRIRVYEGIAKQIAGEKGDATKVAGNRERALRFLYLKTQLVMQLAPYQPTSG